MKVANRMQMQALDRYTMEMLGLPGVVLMENAGAAVVKHIMRDFPSGEAKVVVLAGAGNNGGDGFVIARRLVDYGYDVGLVVVAPKSRLKGDALCHYEVYEKRGLPVVTLEEVGTAIARADVIVDALLGTGAQGEVREPYKQVIEQVNASAACVYAVDVPSGVCADTGEVVSVAVRADKTITFALPKRGFYVQDGPLYTGEIHVENISVPTEKIEGDCPVVVTERRAREFLPKRPPNGHKGTFGHVLVIGGSRQYVGAPIYSAKTAFAVGAGLVTLSVPMSSYSVAAMQAPECIHQPLSDVNGVIDVSRSELPKLSSYKVVAVGPGLGRQLDGHRLLRNIVQQLDDQALLLDADALYFAKELLPELLTCQSPIMMTPHPGEMAHLLGVTVEEVEKNRFALAKQFATEYNVYLLLKGHRTIITTPQGQQWVVPIGSDALGKGGSGDVLTGAIAGLLAQGAEPEQAFISAAYFHALAAEQLASEQNGYTVKPEQVAARIGRLF